MPLTDPAVRNAKPADKPIRLFDGGGLYLEVAPSGGKWWRFKYRYLGKEKRLSLGVYPEVSLKDARARRDEARRLLSGGTDPSAFRKMVGKSRLDAAANSFEAVTLAWHKAQLAAKKKNGKLLWTQNHAGRVLRRLERDVFPWLAARPIADITTPELLATLRRVESRGAHETTHRLAIICSQIFRYAVREGKLQNDPTSSLRGGLVATGAKHFAAVTKPEDVAKLLRIIDDYQGTFVVACALKLAPLLFVRPGELRTAKWADIDLDAAQWCYTATKTDTLHIVPLSTQSVKILRELQALTGRNEYVFPGARTNGRPMSENAILAALRNLGIPKEEMTPHGFRAMARTLLEEVKELHFRPEIIEQQLAHTVRDPLGRAYNRTTHLEERGVMMQAWADYLDKLKAGADVISIHGNASKQ